MVCGQKHSQFLFTWNASRVSANHFIYFLDAAQSLVSKSVRPEDVGALQSELNLALTLMEWDFPMDIQVST